MADSTINALPALAAADIAVDDLVEIVDVSDTTLAPTGTNKRTTSVGVARSAGGQWFPTPTGTYVQSLSQDMPTNFAACNGLCTWSPIYVDRTLTLAAVAVNVQTAEAGAISRLGLYECDIGAGTLGDRVADYGTIDASTTGFKEATGSTVVTAGWYALCAAASSHTGVRYYRPNFVAPFALGVSTASVSSKYWGWLAQSVDYTAALPATGATGVLMHSGSGNVHYIVARFS